MTDRDRLSPSLHKVPLSAFIVEDMMEFVHAHASYRFVIQDEEEERSRILVSNFYVLPMCLAVVLKPAIDLVIQTPDSAVIYNV